MNKGVAVERRAMKKAARLGVRGATDMEGLVLEAARKPNGPELALRRWIKAHNKYHGGKVKADRCGGECNFDLAGLSEVSSEAFDLDNVA